MKVQKLCFLFIFLTFSISVFSEYKGIVSGRIVTADREVVNFAIVHLKGSARGSGTNKDGLYHIKAPAGKYTLVVTALGYKTVEKTVKITDGERTKLNIVIEPDIKSLKEVAVTGANGVNRINKSAYNAIALDAKNLHNTTQDLAGSLAKIPGVKVRESGGLGSSTSITLDGFSGKHVKIFIDGVPQEGVGSSFGLNNIPINFADRIEVYKGVVPVGFGTDALGGVINIVTNKKRRNWFVDASYSYGSFNTHKSYVNFGQTFKNGFTYEINAFQNYSDNDYHVDAPIKRYKEDGTTDFDTEKTERVKRFHDTYHNEAVVAKIGVEDKYWADRLMFGFTYSNMYQEIQTGVRQKTVFGEKHRKGHSLMPSLEYNKHNLFTKGLDVVLTANYNRNITYNVDTTRYEYNWLGEKKLMNSRGEQSYQHTRSNNDNWNATLTVNYQIARMHMFTFNNVWNAFHRNNTSLLAEEEATDAIAKETRKNIAGLSYRLMPSDRWNLSVFGKYYRQYVAGPMATDDNASDYVRTSRTTDSWGYGIAGTYFILSGLQTKLSYEKAYRLPTIEEMFGDEDLESGNISIRPENSNNINVNLSYTKTFGKHSVYVEGGFIYRNTQDYIQRNIQDLSGGKENATYINYGKVLTKGFNISARYGFSKWLSIGGNFTKMDVRDNEEYQIGSMGNSVKNLAYKSRMPNVPYIFSDSDINFYWHGLFKKGNVLTVTYDNLYLHSFSYYSQAIGKKSDFVVPNQFSHNLTVSYSIQKGRYNFSFECRNLTNEKLYDNFSLQKAGRAFYGKVRVYFGK